MRSLSARAALRTSLRRQRGRADATEGRCDQSQEAPSQPALDHELELHELPDHELELQELPDHELPDQELPDQELPDQELPDQELPLHDDPLQLLPFQRPPDQLEPVASRIAIVAASKGLPKMSFSPWSTTP
jgi:hypothetical protein